MLYFSKSFFRISLLLILITTILLLCVVYVQYFGSGLNIFSGLFLSSLVPVKTKSRLTKKEREEFVIPENLREILVGLFLGDLHAQKKTPKSNAYLKFEQGFIHKDYLDFLYELFQHYCSVAPKINNRTPDKRTGNIYTRVLFHTYCLPCFTQFHNIFYLNKKKIVPSNIAELLTPLGLAHWICDDGGWSGNSTRIHANSYTLEEVNLLVQVLNDKFNLKCTILKSGTGYIIRISTKSMPVLQELLKDIMPPMMRHKVYEKSSSTFSSNPENSCL